MNKNPSLKLYENAHYEKYDGNYFSLPNEIFSLGLDATAIAVFAYLRRLENHRKLFKFDTPFSTVFSRQKSRKKNT